MRRKWRLLGTEHDEETTVHDTMMMMMRILRRDIHTI